MKDKLIRLFTVIVIAFLQPVVISNYADLGLILITFITVKSGLRYSYIYAFLAGLIIDLFNPLIIGMTAFCYLTIIFVIDRLKVSYFSHPTFVHYLIAALIAMAIKVITFSFIIYLYSTQFLNVALYLKKNFIIEIIGNLILLPIFYIFIYNLNAFPSYKER